MSSWLAVADAPPCNVRVLVEGEEEIGSPHLERFLTEHSRRAPSRRARARRRRQLERRRSRPHGLACAGSAAADVTVRALDGPVHSGMAGGLVPDPVLALARLLASLVDEHGAVAIDGFDAGVGPWHPTERARLDAAARRTPARCCSTRRRAARACGASAIPSVSPFERLWLRPALTVIGFDSHPIAGSSNQIVASASARLSLRLAAGQEPDRVRRAIASAPRTAGSVGARARDRAAHEGSPGVADRARRARVRRGARRALRDGFGTEPVLMGVGGSIPFVGPFVAAFGGIPAVLLGPADPASRIHGEDESLHLDDWRKLVESEVRLLSELASLPATPRPSAHARGWSS